MFYQRVINGMYALQSSLKAAFSQVPRGCPSCLECHVCTDRGSNCNARGAQLDDVSGGICWFWPQDNHWHGWSHQEGALQCQRGRLLPLCAQHKLS